MKKGFEMTLFGIAFVMLVLAAVTYLRREDNDFTKFKNAAEATQKEVASVNKKLDELKEQNKKLLADVEAAHGQADAAKSKAELAESLAHKVAIDVARRPAQAVGAQTPIKVEPIRVVIYDKRNLQQTTKKVKPETAEQKVIKNVKEKMKTLNQ
jgi:multidrug resistance efflux pump